MHAEFSSLILEIGRRSLFVLIGMNESRANILLFPIKENMNV